MLFFSYIFPAVSSESNFNIGVEYKTSNIELGVIDPGTLEGSDIEFIRLQWIDLSNTLRSRTMPVSYFKKLLASKRGGINIARTVLGFVNSSIAEGFYHTHEYFYALDVNTLRRCPYEPGHASLMGWFQEKAPVESPNETFGIPGVSLCSRTTLKRVVDRAEAESHVKFLIGFESEFVLLKSTEPVEVVGTFIYSTSSALRPGAPATKVLNAIAKAVKESGIELQVYHGEAAPGQYEVVTGPLPPLEAVDALIHTREIIYNTAALYGLRATFAPRISMQSIGTAAHAHISVHSTLQGAARGTSMSDIEKSFLAGLMKHLRSLPALTLPTSASYARVGDGLVSGGTYVCWGKESREAPIRLINPDSPSSRRLEMRFIDGTANPYLALAGIIGVGHAGIRQNLELTVQDCSGSTPAAYMSEDERKAIGIVDRMPLSWEEGRKNIQSDPELESILGKNLLEAYLSVNTLLESTLNNPAADADAKLKAVIDFY